MVQHLLARGEHEVVGVDITDEKLAGINGKAFTFIAGDITGETPIMEDVIRASDLVVDLVAYANPSLYITSPLEVFELNFMQNLRVAQLCMKHNKKLIQYSSAEVYGKLEEGTAYFEDDSDSVFGPTHKQRWIYAAGKALLERVLYAHGAAGDLEYVIIRPFNFIGSRIDYLVSPGTMGGPRVFAHFMSALLGGGPIYLVEGGKVHRAFLHIEEANTAFQTVLDHPEQTRNQIFNIGNPANNTTIRALAYLMVDLYEELTGQPPKSEIRDVGGEEFYGPGYEDSDRLPPDITKLRLLGWKPQHNLRKTFRDTMAYYLENSAEAEALQRYIPKETKRRDGFVDPRPRRAG
jgi:nucleoside-diphosphate-sugar epimerase